MKKKKIWICVALAVGIGVVSVGIYFVQGKPAAQASAQEMSIQETQAKTGTIANTIVGTGNLQHKEGETITIPSGIVVQEVNVEAGDYVSKGDVLATVNQTSVLRAIESVQEEMEALDEEIDENMDDSDIQSITSKVDGRVKKIYVKEEQEVSECMVEQGALLLLSMDGYLAVEVETDAELIQGDTVIVTRSDDSQREGTVESIMEGTCIILCSDSGIGIEEHVAITDSEGNSIGNGVTYIHQQLAITASSGIVEELCVVEDEMVYTGTTLLKVDHNGQSLEYQEKMAERQELAEELQELMALSQNGIITAKSDGMIQTVNISSENSQTAEKAAETIQLSKHTAIMVGSTQNTSSPKEEEQPLSLEITDSGTADSSTLVVETPKTGAKPQIKLTAGDGSYEGMISWKPNHQIFASETSYQADITLMAKEGYCFSSDSIGKVKIGVLSGLIVSKDGKTISFQITYPLTEKEDNDHDSGNGDNSGNGNDSGNGSGDKDGKDGEDGNTPGDKDGKDGEDGNDPGDKDGNGSGDKDGKDGEDGDDPGDKDGKDGEDGDGPGDKDGKDGEDGDGEGDKDGEDGNGSGDKDGEGGSGNDSEDGNGDGSGKENGEDENPSQNDNEMPQQNDLGNHTQTGEDTGNGTQDNSVKMANASDSGISAAGTGNTSVSTNESQSSTTKTDDQDGSTQENSNTSDSEVAAFTMAVADTMVLSVNVDELDINSVSKDQQAEVTLDAIEDETYTGTVTKVGSSASSSSGGVAKYTVELTIAKDERMKEGMNASAVITIEERENVVTIPVNALQERGNRVFVFTEKDGDGNLSGEQEVTTGLSDGNTVEIAEGLSEGDIIYYQKTGNTSRQDMKQNFEKMEGGPDRNMGEMPQGEFPGGSSERGMPGGGRSGREE